MIVDLKETFKEKYKDIIVNVEGSLKTVEENISTVDKNDQMQVKRLKRKLDDTVKLIEDEKAIDNQFNELFSKLERKLKYLSLKDLLKEDFKFSLSGKLGRLGWNGNDDPVFKVLQGGTSYKTYYSSEAFESELTCKVKIISLTQNLLNGYWNYGFGLIKDGSENNQSSYYTHSVVLQGNGHCNVKFSGSSDTINKELDEWKEGDELCVQRDGEGSVFFSINDGERKRCFTEINGRMRIVMGFSTSVNGNEFEMVECGAFY
mmetsp:Transcript_3377/g.3408  ORF Transcript_3377/g.3408 Transcript_3377/m.3408 type:complete len:261 (+) Transcript_3377:182-964(+)